MKSAKVLLLLLAVLTTAVLGHAQSPTPLHVILVIQENRTPDNLFQDQALINNGADIWNINNEFNCEAPQSGGSVEVYGAPLNACFDPNHGHELGWEKTYNQGNMNGACEVYVKIPNGCTPPSQTPAVTYAENLPYDGTNGILSPYYKIAETYGFANYMFQTNQGPSFPAHQFLFSGTSAPVDPPTNYYNWFVAENPAPGSDATIGCTAPVGESATEIDPNSNESSGYIPYDYFPINAGYPCYSHLSMGDLLDSKQLSWKYYAPPDGEYNIWTAPNALEDMCGQLAPGGACNSTDWMQKVIPPTSENPSPILMDIQNCNLAAVSWVIPDGIWSDHAGSSSRDAGPSWVGAIVNAVGESTTCDNNPNGYWDDTVILITWDDWGGFFDHVPPPDCQGATCEGYGNSNGSGKQYVYGFRVPLLVVSAYANQNYISGACGIANAPSCPNEQPQYKHDFGSILGYIEHVFGTGEINSSYHYADYYAPDGTYECQSCTYPLSDFFGTVYHPFAPISGEKYPLTCFTVDPQTCFGSDYPSDPDDDQIDPQD